MRRANINVRHLKEQICMLVDNLPVAIPDDEANEAIDGILNLLGEISEGGIVCFYKDQDGTIE